MQDVTGHAGSQQIPVILTSPGPAFANDNPPPRKGPLRAIWNGIKFLADRYPGKTAYALNVPPSASLIYIGMTTDNIALTASGVLSCLMDATVIIWGDRELKPGATDPQDEGVPLARIYNPVKYPYEFAGFWGEVGAYGTMFLGGLGPGAKEAQQTAFAIDGAANLIGIPIVMIPEKEKAQERYKMNIPYVPRLLNKSLESFLNFEFNVGGKNIGVKPVTDFVVTHPAAASSILAIAGFGWLAVAKMAEVGGNFLKLDPEYQIYLPFSAASWAFYCFVQKRQRPATVEFNESTAMPESRDIGIVPPVNDTALPSPEEPRHLTM